MSASVRVGNLKAAAAGEPKTTICTTMNVCQRTTCSHCSNCQGFFLYETTEKYHNLSAFLFYVQNIFPDTFQVLEDPRRGKHVEECVSLQPGEEVMSRESGPLSDECPAVSRWSQFLLCCPGWLRCGPVLPCWAQVCPGCVDVISVPLQHPVEIRDPRETLAPPSR